MSARIDALLLDAAGTALELREPAADVYVRIAAAHGILRARDDVDRALAAVRIGPPALDGVPLAEVPARERQGWREIARAALGDTAADGPCFDALFAHFASKDAWRLTPDLRDALDEVRARGVGVAIVSNMDARLPALLAGLGLSALLDAIVLPSTCGLAKPDPRIFLHALERLRVPASAALYVGDRERDCVAAARAAGLRAARYDPAAPAGTPGVVSGWRELARSWTEMARLA